MIQKVTKVVRRHPELSRTYCSALMSLKDKGLRYDIFRVVFAPEPLRPIFAFNSVPDAMKWISQMSIWDAFIFEAEAELDGIVKDDVLKSISVIPPTGTIFCSSIKLIKLKGT